MGTLRRVVGQGQGQRRGLVGLLAVLVDEVAHAGQTWGVGFERGGDGAFERERSVGVEQLDEATGEDAEVMVAFRSGGEQGLGRGSGVVEAVGGAVLTGVTLVAFERLDVRAVFDLLSAVERAPMGGEHGARVEHVHRLEGGRDHEGAFDIAVRDRVVVGAESYVGGLGDLDLDSLLAGEGVVGECEQMGALLVEDLGDGAPGVLGTGAFGGAGAAPLIDLSVEVVEVTEAPGGEEALAHEADEPFHAALLIAARRRDRTRLEVVVRGELKHRGMEPDGVGAPFEHDASHVV